MKNAEFDAFLDRCVAAAQRKNERLEAERALSSYARWDYDEETQLITFSNPGKRPTAGKPATLAFRYTDVGTFSLESQSWLWAWANESNSEEMVEKAVVLQELHQATRKRLFTEPLIECDEYLAWALAAVAVEHFGSLGVYRAPVEHLWVFMSLDEVVE